MTLMHRIRSALIAALVALAPAVAFANTTTTNLGLNKPGVGADSDAWGAYLNTNADTVDALFNSSPALLLTKGGTGATTAAGARTALGLVTAAGTWTPAVSFATPGTSSIAYTTQSGNYRCVAGLVYIDFVVTFTPTIGTASGIFHVTGMPYSIAAASVQQDSGSISTITATFVGYSGTLFWRHSDATHLQILYASAATGGASSFAPANLTTGALHSLGGSITFPTSTASC